MPVKLVAVPRKPVSITGTGTSVWIVCDDGTIWHNWDSNRRMKENYWEQVPNVPQSGR